MSPQGRSGAHSSRSPEPSSSRWLWIVAIAVLVAILGVVLFLVLRSDDEDQPEAVVDGVGAIGDEPCPPPGGAEERTTEFDSGPQACIDPERTYRAVISTTRGEFTVELDTEAAPTAVNNFVFLARHRFYDGVAFHRVIPGFVVQGGDANGNPPGSGDPGYSFPDELPQGDPPHYEVGSLAMANSGPNTNGSQFFVVTGDQGAQLTPDYSRFGQVVDGLDVVLEIDSTGSPGGQPTEETSIESVTIEEE